MTEQHVADWYPDPMGRHEYRWYDGTQWTERVASHGRESHDPLTDAKQVVVPKAPEKLQQQVVRHQQNAERRGAPGGPPTHMGGGHLLDEPILVVNQKVKLIEVNTEFALYDQSGGQIGAVRQVGQSRFKKVFRFFGSWDQYFTHKYQVVDRNGIVQLALTRPAKFFKSRVIVQDAAGTEVGQIVQQNVFGKIRFNFVVGGVQIGRIQAENWRAWNFSLRDENDREVARITKTFEGVLKTMFTTADNYVLQVHEPLSDPLRQLVYASAVSIDTALKQDARGLGSGGIGNLIDF